MNIQIQASTRLSSGLGVFASGHDEAGKALKAIGAILGGNFVTDEDENGSQSVVWRSPDFKATLTLDTEEDVLEFDFVDKNNAGSFSAEGYNVATLLKDIHYNVNQFSPTKQVSPKIKELRQKFGAIH